MVDSDLLLFDVRGNSHVSSLRIGATTKLVHNRRAYNVACESSADGRIRLIFKGHAGATVCERSALVSDGAFGVFDPDARRPEDMYHELVVRPNLIVRAALEEGYGLVKMIQRSGPFGMRRLDVLEGGSPCEHLRGNRGNVNYHYHTLTDANVATRVTLEMYARIRAGEKSYWPMPLTCPKGCPSGIEVLSLGDNGTFALTWRTLVVPAHEKARPDIPWIVASHGAPEETMRTIELLIRLGVHGSVEAAYQAIEHKNPPLGDPIARIQY